MQRTRNLISLRHFSLETLAILFFTLYYLMPAFSNRISFIMALILQGGYACYAMLWNQRERREIAKYGILILFVAGCYFFLTTTSTIDPNVSNYQLKRFLAKLNQLVKGFFPVVLLLRVEKKFSNADKKKILFIVLLVFAYVILSTRQGLLVDARAARTWSGFSNQTIGNIGTYSFIYAVSAFLPILFHLLLSSKGFGKLICSVVIVALYLFLFMAQYTLAILIPSICICIILLQRAGHSRAGIMAFGIIAPVVMLLLPNLLMFVSDNIKSSDISIRLREVSMMLQGGSELGYNAGGRLSLYGRTIEAFLHSPVIGNRSLGFDGHATLLTVLADIGLLGSVPYYYLYFSMRKRVTQILHGYENIYFTTWFALIMMGYVNPIHAAEPLSFMVWFIVPLMIDVFGRDTVFGMRIAEER